jgi:hypothetical protein
MTLSCANCSCDGATMLSPGGAFLFDKPGVLAGKPPSSLSLALSIGASPGFAVCCNRDSMMCRCCSRTEILRCSCSLIAGSCVMKPGERHASPISATPSPESIPLDVKPPADGLELPSAEFCERSSFRGRWREAGNSGEDGGSFFTIICGGAAFRALRKLDISQC